MFLRKNQYYNENFTSGWIIKQYPYNVIYDNTTMSLYDKKTRKFNPTYIYIYISMAKEAFGHKINDMPLLSLTNLPKNKLRFYFISKQQFEKFKEIILILKLTK